ncbi:peptide ABC transporter substrate-binding protein [Aristaeella lactis]|uniref:Oligopeptide transport system substrate-binding protein n=1 Tax=Aristaeella lactis TaxID=3046383 RepID=A0AC61PHT2_9FIRM|nr:peptide ABC transporter substrate-binding protein [Aristaeella lactis]QUA53531.1 peptide ABC transporter substrate-binding protein [Aristaeella lactis]SMC36529.1 oligopeptide transport system substrate-binding protein [Aristaeella lactis]
MKKLTAILLSIMMLLACVVTASAEDASYLGVMLGTNVMSLDTNLATDGDSFEVIADCIDGLMQMDKDGAAVPAIAESYDLSEDGLTYTFHLRDAKWNNGTAVTANDFVFAWRRIAKEAGEYAYMLDEIGNIKGAAEIISGSESDLTTLGVNAADDKTLVVELNVPVSFFPSLMYFPTFYPINEEFYNSLADGTYGTSPETFLSNGAFVLESYTPGTANLSVKKNPDYWDADRVKLAGITYQVVGSSDNALTAFRNNTLDVVMISGDQVDAAKKDAALAEKLKVTGAGYMWYLSFSQTEKNAEGGMLANANLRLAISNAIDRDNLVDNYVMDGSLATFTAVPPQFAASSTTGEDFSANQDAFTDYVGYNPEKAAEYYEAAKAELGKDSFTFTMIYGNNEGDEVQKVAQAIKEDVEDALPGVVINLQSMTKAERLDKMQNDNYDIALTRWGPDYADPMTYLGMWVTNNSNNYGFWSNAEFDQLIADCTTGAYITDYDARWDAMFKAETLVMQEAVIAPLYTKANANLITDGVEGIDFHPVALNRVYKDTTK